MGASIWLALSQTTKCLVKWLSYWSPYLILLVSWWPTVSSTSSTTLCDSWSCEMFTCCGWSVLTRPNDRKRAPPTKESFDCIWERGIRQKQQQRRDNIQLGAMTFRKPYVLHLHWLLCLNNIWAGVRDGNFMWTCVQVGRNTRHWVCWWKNNGPPTTSYTIEIAPRRVPPWEGCFVPIFAVL